MENELNEEERSRLCVEFALHARQIRATLDGFAEKLAKGDKELRAELRLIEEFLW